MPQNNLDFLEHMHSDLMYHSLDFYFLSFNGIKCKRTFGSCLCGTRQVILNFYGLNWGNHVVLLFRQNVFILPINIDKINIEDRNNFDCTQNSNSFRVKTIIAFSIFTSTPEVGHRLEKLNPVESLHICQNDRLIVFLRIYTELDDSFRICIALCTTFTRVNSTQIASYHPVPLDEASEWLLLTHFEFKINKYEWTNDQYFYWQSNFVWNIVSSFAIIYRSFAQNIHRRFINCFEAQIVTVQDEAITFTHALIYSQSTSNYCRSMDGNFTVHSSVDTHRSS